MAKKSAARKPISKMPTAKTLPAMERSGTHVVAKAPNSDRPKKGPDGLTDEQRLKLLSETKERLREASYHEAGHAVWVFLDGRLDSIKRIRIGYEGRAGGLCEYGYGSYATKNKLAIRRSQCQLAAAYIALQFSGPVCEYIHTKESDPWERMLDEWHGSEEEAGRSKSEFKCDFQQAMEICFEHFGTHHRQLDRPGDEVMGLLKTVWGWSWDVFSEPKAWKVVNTLAKALKAQAPGTMWGKTIQPMIRDSWRGPRNQVPMAYLGEPHVSRFGIEAGVHRPF